LELASQIRLLALEAHKRGKLEQSVKIPDASIAATGVIYRAAVLYTFDPILLAINGWPILGGMAIARPGDERYPLGF